MKPTDALWYFAHGTAWSGPQQRDKTPVETGTWLPRVDGELQLRKNGYHAYENAISALLYGWGPWVSQVELGETVIIDDEDRHIACGATRKHLWVADASEALKKFSRWCAYQVSIDWDCPRSAENYLLTGDDEHRLIALACCKLYPDLPEAQLTELAMTTNIDSFSMAVGVAEKTISVIRENGSTTEYAENLLNGYLTEMLVKLRRPTERQ